MYSFPRQIQHVVSFRLLALRPIDVSRRVGLRRVGSAVSQLLEIAVCRDYYEKNIDDYSTAEHCKIKEVQVQLSFGLTVLSTCSVLAATLMQIPIGLLADRKGRRTALLLNITSTILYWGWLPVVVICSSLPLWAIYFAPIFVLIGGGPWASGALIFAAINQGTTPKQRTPTFSIMEAVAGMGSLIGLAVGSLTMEKYIWLPFLLATLSFALMFIPALLLTDERKLLPQQNKSYTDRRGPRCTESEHEPLLRHADTSIPSHHREGETPIRSTAVIYAVAFGSFFLLSLARDANNFFIPWISWRFDESMARAGLIFSLRAIVSSAVFFLLLPLASAFISKNMNMGPSSHDLFISASSAVLLCTGSLVIATSSNISMLVAGFCTTTLGCGVTVSLRAFLASKVDKAFSGRLFTAISTTATIGSLVGMPLTGALYSLSISKDIGNVSLPFAMASAAYFLVSGVIASLQFSF